MTGNNLTVVGVKALSNKELTTELYSIITAIEQGNRSAWDMAIAYHNIIKGELYDEDFETMKDFADFVGVSKATITQYVKAVEFMVSTDSSYDLYSVGVAYLLSTLEDYADFAIWADEQDIDLTKCSVKAIQTLIKEYKARFEEEETEETEETEDTTGEEEEIEDTTGEEDGGLTQRELAIAKIRELMEQYEITVDEL